MKQSIYVLKEQCKYLKRVLILSRYEMKSSYQAYYLGKFWEILNPLIQILIYYFIFGVRLGANRYIEKSIPYLLWMIGGLIPWFFLSSSIVQSTNSVYSKAQLINRMNFPVSTLPLISIVNCARKFVIMNLLFVPILFVNNIIFTAASIQFIIYFILLILFLDGLGLFLSTVTVFFRDFTHILTSVIRVLFYISGVTVEVGKNQKSFIDKFLSMNPLNFYIEGFRDSYFSRNLFLEKCDLLLLNICIILFLFISGSMMQVSLKRHFSDYT
ncbi:ABC transporter permease [Enterococcus avium]|uniref:ABC transporter permease n=1 Tax=Enterococcus avium TaxID=33945 RepID=UPI001F5B0125|nr:ABC transporter permease [Enterococcus avium]